MELLRRILAREAEACETKKRGAQPGSTPRPLCNHRAADGHSSSAMSAQRTRFTATISTTRRIASSTGKGSSTMSFTSTFCATLPAGIVTPTALSRPLIPSAEPGLVGTSLGLTSPAIFAIVNLPASPRVAPCPILCDSRYLERHSRRPRFEARISNQDPAQVIGSGCPLRKPSPTSKTRLLRSKKAGVDWVLDLDFKVAPPIVTMPPLVGLLVRMQPAHPNLQTRPSTPAEIQTMVQHIPCQTLETSKAGPRRR